MIFIIQVSPAFQNFSLHFYLFSLTKGIQKEFSFLWKKRTKSENSIQRWFFMGSYRGRGTWAAKVAPLSSFPKNHTKDFSIKLPKLWALWASALYLHLFCAPVSKMHPMVIAPSLYAVLAFERFHKNGLISKSGETCINKLYNYVGSP